MLRRAMPYELPPDPHTARRSIGATDAEDMLAAGEEAGSPVTLHVCADAGHAASPTECGEEYAGWVLGFLERHLAPPG